MKIFGVGVDLIDNNRIKLSIKNKSFLTRTFSSDEIKNSNKVKNKSNYFAKKFAAKESLDKAIGTGFRNNINFKDIQILNDFNGKHYYHKTKKINDIIHQKFKIKKYNLFLSISDEKDYSIAFTIIQK